MTSGVDRPKAQRHSWRIFAGNLGAGGFSGSGSRIKYFSISYFFRIVDTLILPSVWVLSSFMILTSVSISHDVEAV